MNFATAKGFTLVEVLVALVILSIGMVGLAAVQVVALQNTQGGYFRGQASFQAYDILDRMRANLPGVKANGYDIALAAPAPANPGCLGVGANCSSTQMASFDVVQWRVSLAAYFPNGNGAVSTVNLGTTTRVTVTIQWLDPYRANAGNDQLIVTEDLPR